ncbi:MAG: hypothetical protein ACYC26_04525 [Phycisphaerales bacterium]
MTYKPPPLAHEEQIVAMEAIRHWFAYRRYELIAAGVGPVHTHLLGHLPMEEVDAAMGWLKKYVSQKLGKKFASRKGGLFAARGEPKPVRTLEHFCQAHPYILEHQKEDAVVWGVAPGQLHRLWNTLG